MSYTHIPGRRQSLGEDDGYTAEQQAALATQQYQAFVLPGLLTASSQIAQTAIAKNTDVAYLKQKDATDYPWGKYSDKTRTLQDNINQVFGQAGTVCKLPRTGILDALTCGAARASFQYQPYSCQSYSDNCPAVVAAIKADEAAKAKVTNTVAKPTLVAVQTPLTQTPANAAAANKVGASKLQANMLMGGAALFVVAGLGYYMAKKKGWLK